MKTLTLFLILLWFSFASSGLSKQQPLQINSSKLASTGQTSLNTIGQRSDSVKVNSSLANSPCLNAFYTFDLGFSISSPSHYFWSWSGEIGNIYPCIHDDVILYTDSVQYAHPQWYLDDKKIEGATGFEYKPTVSGKYAVKVSLLNCEYTPFPLTVKLKEALSFTITSINSTVHPNNIVDICDTGGFTTLIPIGANDPEENWQKGKYQWFKNNKPIDNATKNNLIASEEGEYRLQVKEDMCMGSSQTIKVQKKSKIPANLILTGAPRYTRIPQNTDNKISLCRKEFNSVDMLLAGDGTKELFKNGQLVPPTKLGYGGLPTPFFFIEFANSGYNAIKESGLYKLRVTQGNCVAEDSINITYEDKKDINVQAISLFSKDCKANNSMLYAQSANPLYCKWYKDNKLVANSNFMIATEAGDYQLVYNNASECTGTSKIVTYSPTVKPPYLSIDATAKSKKITLCKGTYYQKLVEPFVSGATWKKDGQTFVLPPYLPTNYLETEQPGKYWIEYKIDNCIYTSDTLTIDVIDLPQVTVIDSCMEGNTSKIYAKGTGNAYQWYKDDFPISNATNNTFIPTEKGAYYVITEKNGCFRNSQTIQVTPFSISPTYVNICRGDSLKINANGSNLTKYVWTSPDGKTYLQQNLKIAKAKFSGNYQVVATTNNGCTYTAQSSVKINDNPSFNINTSIIACESSDFQLNAITPKLLTDTTSNPFRVDWQSTTNSYSEYYNSPVIIPKITMQHGGLYKVRILSDAGCAIDTTVQLTVVKNGSCSSINIINDISFCNREKFRLAFESKNFPKETIFRVIDSQSGIELGRGSTSPITINSDLIEADSGSVYIISSTNMQSAKKIYHRREATYTFLDNSNEQLSICTTTKLDYQVSDPIETTYVHGSSGIYPSRTTISTYQFWNDNKVVSSGKLSYKTTPTPLSFNVSQTGNYQLNIYTEEGCFLEGKVHRVIVGKMNKPSIIGNPIITCGQSQTSLNASGILDNAINYRWKRNGQVITETTNPVLTVKQEGIYTVEATKGSCNSAISDSIKIINSPNNNISIKFILNGTNTLDCLHPNVLATWSSESVDSISSNVWKVALYKNGALIPTKRYKLWNQLILTDAGTYQLKITNGTCIGISNTIQVIAQKFALFPPAEKKKELCENLYPLYFDFRYETSLKQQYIDYETQQYLNVTQFIGSEWFKNGLPLILNPDDRISTFYDDNNQQISTRLSTFNAGKYVAQVNLKLDNGSQCQLVYDTIDVSILKKIILPNDKFDPAIGAIPITSCAKTINILGDSYYGKYFEIGNKATKYTWKKDGVITKDSTASILISQSGTYQLETLYKGGCSISSQPYKVTLEQLDILTNHTPSVICEGYNPSTTFLGTVVGVHPDSVTTYQWKKDDKVINNERNNSYRATEFGVYTLTAKNSSCEITSKPFILKEEAIRASIIPSDSIKFCEGKTIALSTSNETGLTYQWEQNSTTISNATQATYNVSETGNYRVFLQRNNCWNYTKSVYAQKTSLPTAAISGEASVNYLDSSKVSVTLTAAAPWTLKLSNGNEYTTNKSPFTFNVKPLTSTTYTLAEVKNMCGIGTVSGAAKIEVIILSTEEEQVNHVSVFPIPTTEKCTWKINLEKASELTVSLFDATGVLIKEDSIGKREISHEGIIDMEQLSSGTYLLKIQAGDKIITRKIVKY